MRKVTLFFAIAVVIIGIVAGGYFLWDQATRVSATELEQIVQRDAVPFEAGSIPDEVLDRVAAHRVVLVGETHFLGEHTEFTFELLRELHARGFRQFLFEWSQAADWALADFVNDGGLIPDWTAPSLLGDPIIAIRDFNRTVPEDERIQVHAIDIHLKDYGDTEGWLSLMGYAVENILAEPGPLSAFMAGDHGTYENHQVELERLRAEVEDGRDELTAAWGNYWYDTIVEIIEVELLAVEVRALRESNYYESVRLREEAIKLLADRRIKSTPHGTLINVGSTHAQKERLWGTDDIEWLGDYLVHESPVTKGSVMALWVPAAYIVAAPGSAYPDFDLVASPENELLSVMNQNWPNQIVFLPLDDPLFTGGRVPINSSGDIFVASPKDHYDALALLPIAHRDLIEE